MPGDQVGNYVTTALGNYVIVHTRRRLAAPRCRPRAFGSEGGLPRRYGGILTIAKPDIWHQPDANQYGHHPLRQGRGAADSVLSTPSGS